VVVAASGPSLTPEVAKAVRGHPAIAVNDAYRLLPFADVLYACDSSWWLAHKGAMDFKGERWSSHGVAGRVRHNDKSEVGPRFRLNLIEGRDGEGFSTDPSAIHYGSNSGFQAVNMAILWGATRIILVGFDMHGTHFFGTHPRGLRNTTNFKNFIRAFDRAATRLPAGVEILNATPGSALRCFPMVSLHDALPVAA
jgi:hypothetical protein